MKIKIGEKIYTSKEQPIMIILSEEDKKNIAAMLPEARKYCEFVGNKEEAAEGTKFYSEEEIRAWMKDIGD